MPKNKIREKRVALGLSQIKLGLLSGVHNGAISDFELGKREPWPKARKALAKALKVTEAELFGNDNGH
jgi:transcriptional regulator with XRE-family HTH domain